MKSVPKQKWLQSLLNHENQIEVDLSNTAGYLRRSPFKRENVCLSEHLFYFVVSGRFHGKVGNQSYNAEEGGLIWFLPNTPFSDYQVGTRPVIVYRFRLQVISGGVPLVPLLAHPYYPNIPECRFWFEQIVAEAAKPQKDSDFKLRSLLGCLFCDLFRSELRGKSHPRQLSAKQKQEISDFFLQNASNPINPAALARHIKLSPDYFTRVFHMTYGMPPRKWMVHERIRLAALRLIETNQNISEVAGEFGYSDLFFFSRQFKKVMGQSPSFFRKTHIDV